MRPFDHYHWSYGAPKLPLTTLNCDKLSIGVGFKEPFAVERNVFHLSFCTTPPARYWPIRIATDQPVGSFVVVCYFKIHHIF